jgi:ABC-type transport system involved in multi-copper enzyme maturation permease subunit
MTPTARLRHTFRILGSVAWNTFRVAVRNKVFLALFFVAIALMAFGLVLGAMSLHHEARVATNLCLFATTVFGAAMGIYMSVSLFYAELEQRTIYTILSKPVSRWQFILGKYLGTLFTLTIIVGLLAAVGAGLLAVQNAPLSAQFFTAFALILGQLAIISAAAMLFVSFSRPLLSGLFATGIFVLGHLNDQIGQIRTLTDAAMFRRLVDALQIAIPDLAALNIATAVVHELPVTWSYISSAAAYSLLYAGFSLVLAMVLFQRRDLD